MNRIQNLRKLFPTNKIDAIIISSPINIFYLTGFSNFSREEREAYLFITKDSALLFTDSRYIEAVERILPSNIRATIKKPVAKKINQIVKSKNIQTVGFENNLTFTEYEKFKKEIEAKLKLKDYIVEDLRKIKDKNEIELLKKAAKLTDDTYEYVKPLIQTGVTEEQIAYEIESYIKKYGGQLAFESIVAFGPNSSVPHHHTSDKKLSENDEFVLLDFGAKVGGYCSDMTRTVLTETVSNKARKMYKAVLEAQTTAQKVYNALFIEARKVDASEGANVANAVMKKNGFDHIPHGLGHGIGMEVHETPHLHPNSKDTLTEGNYFSIEPGIYIPGIGGVRIEDDFLITKEGLEQLTKSTK